MNRSVLVLVLAVLSFTPALAVSQGLAQEGGGETAEGEPAEEKRSRPMWKCEFGWGPPSFNCFPNQEEEPSEKEDEEALKQQAAVIESIQAKEKELAKRESLLDKRQSQLRDLEQRLERKLDEIRRIQQLIEQARKEQSEAQAKDLAQLVRMYETMDAENAATIINTMDEQTAVNLVLRMNPRKASAILQAAEPEVARDISERIARIKANRELAETL